VAFGNETYKLNLKNCIQTQQYGRQIRDPVRSVKFFNLPNPSSHAGLEFTQPLTEMSTRCRKNISFEWSTAVGKADNLNAICEPIV
jgi:hypothetical protein